MNEDGIIDDYERAYSRGEAQKGQMSSESMGTAAAMSVSPTSQCWTLIASLTPPLPFLSCDVFSFAQAFKKFMGGNDAQKAQSSGGGDMQSKLIGMAMAEAMKVSPFPSSSFEPTLRLNYVGRT